MSPELIALAFMLVFVLLVIGVPLGFATGAIGVGLLWLSFGGAGLALVAQRIYDLAGTFSLLAVPLFIFMSMLLEGSTIAHRMYDSLSLALRRFRGGIAVTTAGMAIIMAAMSGIIGGEIVLLGLVAMPQMLRLGYDKYLTIGTICACGSLGTMIPPSVILIMFGLVTQTSINDLFVAAIIPGLLLGAVFIVYIIVRVRLNPSLAPIIANSPSDPAVENWAAELAVTVFPFAAGYIAWWAAGITGFDDGARLGAGIAVCSTLLLASVVLIENRPNLPVARGLVPPLLIVTVVLGSIYGGITGITEAAAMGVIITLIIIMMKGELKFELVSRAMEGTFRSTGAILWVVFGATVLVGAFSLAGGNRYVGEVIEASALSPTATLLIMLLVFFVLGMFMDAIGIILLTMPIFMPIVLNLGYDPIWFGILFSVSMQVAFLTPPFGSAAFFLKSVAPDSIGLPTIYRSFVPFILLQIAVLAAVFLFPDLALMLVR